MIGCRPARPPRPGRAVSARVSRLTSQVATEQPSAGELDHQLPAHARAAAGDDGELSLERLHPCPLRSPQNLVSGHGQRSLARRQPPDVPEAALGDLVDQPPVEGGGRVQLLAGEREPGDAVAADAPPGMLTVPPAPGISPSESLGREICVPAAATTRRAKAGSSIPDPAQAPCRCAVTRSATSSIARPTLCCSRTRCAVAGSGTNRTRRGHRRRRTTRPRRAGGPP